MAQQELIQILEPFTHREFEVINWVRRQVICLHCGNIYSWIGRKIEEHLYHVHRRRFPKTGIDYLIMAKNGDRYTFYVKCGNSKKKRIVTEEDEKYGKRVKLALEYLIGREMDYEERRSTAIKRIAPRGN